MIKVDGEVININKFPDGTMQLKCEKEAYDHAAVITWFYENSDELIALFFLAKHLRKCGADELYLTMPYIPNARMDRVKNRDEIFTLKYFAELINSLDFNLVNVLDPHSSVSEALINNIVVESPEEYIKKAYKDVCSLHPESRVMTYFPDEGAMKRYASDTRWIYTFGIKRRDWDTGKIRGLDVSGAIDEINGKPVLIIDDICSRGGTFFFSAKKLKELGAGDIYLYITHCEKTIFDGEIFSSGLIKKVYTTNSIFNQRCKEKADTLGLTGKIEVFDYEKD